jgi:hypothetical protein
VWSDGVRQKWQGGKLRDSYFLPNSIRAIESKIMLWVGHAALTGERRGSFSVVVDKSVGNIPLI